MLRLLAGIVLQPLAVALVWSAAKALAAVAARSTAAAPFMAGVALTSVVWLAGRHLFDSRGLFDWGRRAVRWSYVAGHELTHALATWALGGDVFAVKVESTGGHAEVSKSGAFVALAPYCVPFYAMLVVLGYRLLLWMRPGIQADALFLFLMGAALAFHVLTTYQTLSEARQPDLDAAGGKVFSLAVIVCANGVLVLALLKALFPEVVSFGGRLREAGLGAWWFWTGVWRWTERFRR